MTCMYCLAISHLVNKQSRLINPHFHPANGILPQPLFLNIPYLPLHCSAEWHYNGVP